ncbi:WXG100 family type VII secretion target [Nocardia mangyaensis]|uniref:WXG100 family type VII secretion target n=1 Tax=Nocardia mangyaensis TaxID=2213200 RepID=UPI00267475DB|nr:WXG100 family type VII secretion target [Nocardia mangyaensis]MDO3650376.1 WXG100 family type VII secretion target [Nocardia mangyaensis]
MDSAFTVDLDHLDQIVDRLAGLAGYIADHLADVDDRVATLEGSSWEGVANDAYVVAHAQWIAGARDFAEGIRGMSLGAKNALSSYTDAGDTNTRLFRRSV